MRFQTRIIVGMMIIGICPWGISFAKTPDGELRFKSGGSVEVETVVDVVRNPEFRVNSASEVRSDADLKEYALTLLRQGEDVSSIEIAEDTVSLRTKHSARLLWFIPVEYETVLTVDSKDMIHVSTPWWVGATTAETVSIKQYDGTRFVDTGKDATSSDRRARILERFGSLVRG